MIVAGLLSGTSVDALDVAVAASDGRGLPAAAKEAYLIALLGFLTWHQLPGVVPGGTGSRVPRVLGRITPGAGPMRLPDPVPPPRRLVLR